MQILLERPHQSEGMPNPEPMKRSALPLLCLALLAVPGAELSRSAQASSKRLQAQEQSLVQAHKNWSRQTINQRLELLQSTQRCVDAAQSISDWKDCRQRKKQARRSLKQDRRAYLNQIREDVGLPLRQKKRWKQKV